MDKFIDKSNPCYGCVDRKLYCHCDCERYLAYKNRPKKVKADEHLLYCVEKRKKRQY